MAAVTTHQQASAVTARAAGASNARPNRLGERVNMCRMAPFRVIAAPG